MGFFDKIAFWRYLEENFVVMKKQYISPNKHFYGYLVETKEMFKNFSDKDITYFPTLEEVLVNLENGEADTFFEEAEGFPFATWLIPKEKTLKIREGGYQEWWQIEKTAKNSFSVEKVSLAAILATLAKKYIVPIKFPLELMEVQETMEIAQHNPSSEKDGHIRYEEEK